MVMTAVLAFLLIPAASLTRQRQQALRAQDVLLHAREQAIRSAVLAERQRALGRQDDGHIETVVAQSGDPAALRKESSLPLEVRTLLKRLERENAELKGTVELLRLEVERLKAARISPKN